MAARLGGGQNVAAITAYQATLGLTVGLQAAVTQGYREVGQRLPPAVQAIMQAISLQAIPSGRLKAANLQIAQSAQAAIIESWESRLPRNRNGYPARGYRPESRLTGWLGPALKSFSMTEATTDRRISFLNVTTLNSEARHWARVNYGAEGPNLSAGRSAETFVVASNGTAITELRDNTPPAAQTWLPRKYKVSDGDFTPLRGPAEASGRGSAAARFSDIGLKVVATEFFKVYDAALKAYAKEAAGAAKTARLNIDVKADIRTAGIGVTSH